jgi:hypothetical protein
MKQTRIVLSALVLATGWMLEARGAALECENWQSSHPDWLWCDDFENDVALETNYFEVGRANGRFAVSADTSMGGSRALKASYVSGEADAGSLKLSVGRTPVSPQLQTNRDFTDLYWRVYVKVAPGWQGNAMKISRGIVFAGPDWTEAAVGMVWEDSPTGLSVGIDPASGVSGSTVVTTKYNDFANLRWLGLVPAQTRIYAPENQNKWFCLETRMKLNTPGASDGLFTLWINGTAEAQATGLNWRGSYTQYGINAVFLENWINSGPTQNQVRYMDNFVVSTSRIGCVPSAAVRPNPPTNVTAH